jgi:hypothetical protein
MVRQGAKLGNTGAGEGSLSNYRLVKSVDWLSSEGTLAHAGALSLEDPPLSVRTVMS